MVDSRKIIIRNPEKRFRKTYWVMPTLIKKFGQQTPSHQMRKLQKLFLMKAKLCATGLQIVQLLRQQQSHQIHYLQVAPRSLCQQANYRVSL